MTRRLYLLLAILFCLGAASVTTYTVDVLDNMAGVYPLTPFWLGAPWPTVRAFRPQAKAAGLKIGDRVIAVDGRTVRGIADLSRAVRTKPLGEPLVVTAERNGRIADYRVAIQRNPYLPAWYYAAIAWLLMPSLCILLGFWVAAMRPRDGRAWLVLGILLGMSQLSRAGILDPLGWPAFVGVPVRALIVAADPIWAACMLLFGIYFPHRWSLDRRFPWIKWLLIAAIAIPSFLDVCQVVLESVNFPASLAFPKNPLSDQAMFFVMAPIISFFFIGISIKYNDPSVQPDDRRRLKLLYWGCTTAMTPMFLLFLFDVIVRHRTPGDADGIALMISIMLMILFPLTMAYVIVVQRAMDVRVVIRQGLQYALARRGVRIIQVLLTLAVVAGAAYWSNGPQTSRLQRFSLIAIGVVLVVRIREVGEVLRRWVDRRFFREAYNAEQILSELSQQVRSILDRDALFETVARKLSESLHVERIAVMLRDGGVFRPALATGYGGALDASIPVEAPAIGRMVQSNEPLQVDAAELQPLDARMLLPLGSKKELLGFISLGPKKSEEPYSFSDTSLLRTVATQTGLALENSRLSEEIAVEIAKRETLNREIEIAREVQQRLFPQTLPVVPALQYAGHCRPAQGVGGDYYDFLALSDGRLGLAIGDISGKGIPAALLMASLQASVRGQSQGGGGNVAELMTNVNKLVCEASPENRYATFFYAQFDPASRQLIYCNGGHNPPMLLRGTETIRLETGGPPVGLFPFSRYQQDEIRLEHGDLLLLYTDGMSEAENRAEEEWGEDALVLSARACGNALPAEMIASILRDADRFANGAPQHDDMTLVVARVLPPVGDAAEPALLKP